MAFTQIPTSVTILQSGLIGYQAISLTEFTTSAASLIAAGSSVEIAGAYFKAATDITPTATSLTAISSLTTCYLALTPSGTAGSQILTATWQSAAPVWSDSKQGWYASAASNVRYVASMFKVASGNYQAKYILENQQQLLSIMGTRTYSNGTVASDATYIIPAGQYYLGALGTIEFQVRDSSGTWRSMNTAGTTYVMYVISDGNNARVLGNGTLGIWRLMKIM